MKIMACLPSVLLCGFAFAGHRLRLMPERIVDNKIVQGLVLMAVGAALTLAINAKMHMGDEQAHLDKEEATRSATILERVNSIAGQVGRLHDKMDRHLEGHP